MGNRRTRRGWWRRRPWRSRNPLEGPLGGWRKSQNRRRHQNDLLTGSPQRLAKLPDDIDRREFPTVPDEPTAERHFFGSHLENPAAVLREEVRRDHSLLQDTERIDEPEPSAADLELAATLEAETAAEHAAEAEALVSPPERDAPDSLTAESFEEFIEPTPKAAEESLHEEEALRQALLDEGTSLDTLDQDAIEAEILRRPEDERR